MSKVQKILDEMSYGPAPEDAKLALAWIKEHDSKFGVYVGGEWHKGESHFQSLNPSSGEVLAEIAQATNDQIDVAVAAATDAQKKWAALSGSERARYLYALARQVQKHARLFAVLESMDNGKPIRETRDIDIPLVARHFYYHAGWAITRDSELPGYEPVGVCGQIIPWNFPLLMLAWKIAPALAMGNAVILKPAEFTSLTALLFAEICHKVGLPSGVVNIVTGDGEVGKAIVNHPGIHKIAFTGSTEVGKIIRKATAGTEKKLSLELGGKSPFIVFDDADLDSVVEGVVDAIWFNQGQVCCAGSRLLVQEGIAEKLYKKIRARMDTLRIGDPLDKAVDIGAIVDQVQLERIGTLVTQGVSEGATIYQPKCEMPDTGWFYPPTLLTGVEPSATVAQEEIFGPVLVSMTFRTPTEAVALANNSVYGLASSVWTQNVDIAHDIAGKIKAGVVWINCTNQFDASVGFGGYRESGFGREGGKEGLFEYLKPIVNLNQLSSNSANEQFQSTAGLDRTHKLFIGGKQVRPDSGYSLSIFGEEVGRGNRKDVRNAVEAADGAQSTWSSVAAFNRAQILYYFAENFESSRSSLVAAITKSGVSEDEANQEFVRSLDCILGYAAWADKFEGSTHLPPARMHVYTKNEAIGVAAVVAPDASPLLGLLETTMPLIAMGNTVVAMPSESNPLPSVELYRIIEASDFPAGVFNLITGLRSEIVPTFADHAGIAVIWHSGSMDEARDIQVRSAGNLKQTWHLREDLNLSSIPKTEFLRRSTQVKNIWVPYGS